MQSRVRGEESPTPIHSSRGSGCACVCRPCINNAHPTAIVIATPDVRNARLFISLSLCGYPIQMLRSNAAGRKSRVATDRTVAPSPSELPAVHNNAVKFRRRRRRTTEVHAEPAKRSREPGRPTECQVSTEAIETKYRLCFPLFCSRRRSRREPAVPTHLTRDRQNARFAG